MAKDEFEVSRLSISVLLVPDFHIVPRGFENVEWKLFPCAPLSKCVLASPLKSTALGANRPFAILLGWYFGTSSFDLCLPVQLSSNIYLASHCWCSYESLLSVCVIGVVFPSLLWDVLRLPLQVSLTVVNSTFTMPWRMLSLKILVKDPKRPKGTLCFLQILSMHRAESCISSCVAVPWEESTSSLVSLSLLQCEVYIIWALPCCSSVYNSVPKMFGLM